MTTFVVGDVQGCFHTLEELLRKCDFRENHDRILFAGDLVNRGPGSLDVLRWAADRADQVDAVLGNHDLHLIGRHLGVAPARKRDTLADILNAPDRERLIGWLRSQPLVRVPDDEHLVVHAGLPPQMSPDEALVWSGRIQTALAGPDAADLLREAQTRDALQLTTETPPMRQMAAVLQRFTRMRTVDPLGVPLLSFSGVPAAAPTGQVPWFEARDATAGPTVVFGHWSTLGLHLGRRCIGLDTGAVWGGALTAIRLEDHTFFRAEAVPEDTRIPE